MLGRAKQRIGSRIGSSATAKIGGAYLVWQAVREGGAWWLALLGGLALFAYGFVAAFQPDPNFGRILAAYGGVFVAGHLRGESCSTTFAQTASTSSGRTSASSALA